MKNWLLIITLLTTHFAQAQIVNIPDANFKAALLALTPAIDTDQDGEIQVTEANAYYNEIYVKNKNISDLTGIEAFTHTGVLNANDNQLTSVDLSNNHPAEIWLNNNQLTTLVLDGDSFNGSNGCVSFTGNPDLTCVTMTNYLVYYHPDFDPCFFHDPGVYFRADCSNAISDIVSCDTDHDGILPVDLTTKDDEIIAGQSNMTVSYHLSADDAQNNTNPILGIYTNTIQKTQIFTRLTNNTTGDFSTNFFFSIVRPAPIAKDVIFKKCSPDTNVEFMLLDKVQDISNYYGATVTFHLSEADAIANANPINDTLPYTNISNPQTLYARVENNQTGCFSLATATLNIQNCTQKTYIPNDKFEQALINAHIVDPILDDSVWTYYIESLETLNINFKQITDLTGIEDFTNLKELKAKYNKLVSPDLSQLTQLTYLDLSVNKLTSIDLHTNTQLQYLYLSSNKLPSIDLSDLLELSSLSLGSNLLSSINLANNHKIKALEIYTNQLTSLEISPLDSLQKLACQSNQLTTILTDNNPLLTRLWAKNNKIDTLHLTNNPNLDDIRVAKNKLKYLDISNNPMIGYLDASENLLDSINLSNSPNLRTLSLNKNQITNIDISNNPLLYQLDIFENQVTNLDFSNNQKITFVSCQYNPITHLNFPNNYSLHSLRCAGDSLTNLDLSLTSISSLNIRSNPNLTHINLKNGYNDKIYVSSTEFEELPNLATICVDDINANFIDKINTGVGHSVSYSSHCSFASSPYQIIGDAKYDLNNNGCDNLDLAVSNVFISTTNGIDNFATFTQDDGHFILQVNSGEFQTKATATLPSYFTITPDIDSADLTLPGSIDTSDFCLTANQTIADLNISMIPTNNARPGFQSHYVLLFNNIGTGAQSGTITINFDDSKVIFAQATQTPSAQTANSLTFSYTDLLPFAHDTILVDFNIFTPPTVGSGDTLIYTAIINPITGDHTIDDNTFQLTQRVFNSFDPNDITCLQGESIALDEANQYLHYVIRFQNTGTASAENIVVTTDLDSTLDWATLQLEAASHNQRVAIKNGHEVEFIFENIFLADSTANEAASHGYVAYKIKPKSDVVLGDIFQGKADIYFDYNPAIETNIATTEITQLVKTQSPASIIFQTSPNPVHNTLFINTKQQISKIAIYDITGQLILQNQHQNQLDVSSLKEGFYLCRITDQHGNSGITKIVKK